MEYDAWFCSHLMESSNSFSVVGTYRISCSLNVAAKYEQRFVYSTFQGWKEQDLPQIFTNIELFQSSLFSI